MTQIKTHKDRYGRHVRATVTLSITARLESGDNRESIPEREAEQLIERQLDNYAGSNDGSELLANSRGVIPEVDRVTSGPAEGGVFSPL